MIDLKLEDYMGLLQGNYNSFKEFENVKSILVSGTENEEVPLISYIIPTYKRLDTLKDTIISILEQERVFSYEVLIVDNSSDFSENNESKKYVTELKDEHIKYYINEANLGQVGNWNRAFELARGKYVSMIHDDDLLVYDYSVKIKQYIDMAEQMDDKIGVLKGRRIYYSDGEKLPEYIPPKELSLKGFYKINSIAVAGIGPTSCPTCGILFRRDAVIEVGGFCQKFFPSHDYVIGYQILKLGYKVFTADDNWGYYRVGIGESANKEVMSSFVKADFYFREYLYAQSIWTKIFGKIYRNVQYDISVQDACNNARRFGLNMGPEDFDFRKKYNEKNALIPMFERQRNIIRRFTGKCYKKKNEII